MHIWFCHYIMIPPLIIILWLFDVIRVYSCSLMPRSTRIDVTSKTGYVWWIVSWKRRSIKCYNNQCCVYLEMERRAHSIYYSMFKANFRHLRLHEPICGTRVYQCACAFIAYVCAHPNIEHSCVCTKWRAAAGTISHTTWWILNGGLCSFSSFFFFF